MSPRALWVVAVLAASCARGHGGRSAEAPVPDAGTRSGPGGTAAGRSAAAPAVAPGAGDTAAPSERPQLATPERPAEGGFGRVRSFTITSPLPAAVAPPTAPRPPRFRLERTLRVGRSHLTYAEIGPGGRWLFAASEDEATLRLYEFPGGRLVANRAVPGFVRFGRGDFQAWPGGEDPLVLFGSENGIALFDARSGEVLRTVSVRPTWSLRFTRDHRILGALHARIPAQTSALAFYVPTSSGELEERVVLELAERADDWALDSTGTELTLVYYPSGTVETLSLAERRVLWSVEAPRYGGTLDRSPDDRFLAVGGDRLVVLPASEPSRQATYAGYQNNLHAVRFTPDGSALITTSYDGRARVIGVEPRGGELPLLATLAHAGTANVYAASFSPDGQRLVTSSGDQTLKIWKR